MNVLIALPRQSVQHNPWFANLKSRIDNGLSTAALTMWLVGDQEGPKMSIPTQAHRLLMWAALGLAVMANVGCVTFTRHAIPAHRLPDQFQGAIAQ